MTDNTYDKNQVLKMERQILRTIGFDLNIVDVTVFMDKILLIESDLPKEVGVKSFWKRSTFKNYSSLHAGLKVSPKF